MLISIIVTQLVSKCRTFKILKCNNPETSHLKKKKKEQKKTKTFYSKYYDKSSVADNDFITNLYST